MRYGPSPSYPFGRPNPAAPPELEQFAFMIGEFDCVDEIRQTDGTVRRFDAIWNAQYFLNGFGIQDQYWTPRFFTSNLRIYDAEAGLWKVTFVQMPGYQSSTWDGRREGDAMVMRRTGRTEGHGLTFDNITDRGFQWHSGGDNPAWTSTCARRR